jgi:urease gamma subunit
MKPVCKLIGQDSNVFNLMSKVSRVLKKNNLHDQAKEMTDRIFSSVSYDEALAIISEYVEIE